jgi:type I restriction enzyme M protein
VEDYFKSVCEEGAAIPEKLAVFDKTMAELCQRFSDLSIILEKTDIINKEKKQTFVDAHRELFELEKLYEPDRSRFLSGLDGFIERYAGTLPEENSAQDEARHAFGTIAESIRGLIKQIDLLYKLAACVVDTVGDMPLADVEELKEQSATNGVFNSRVLRRIAKQLDEERKTAVEQLKAIVYFHRQIVWLEERFPDARFQAVPGLVKLVDLREIEAADWSLTPGRYVGVAPPEVDEGFDFEQTLRDIHVELADLNKETVELAAKIQENFAELGI